MMNLGLRRFALRIKQPLWVLALTLASGCASLTDGTQQRLNFHTTPEGAEVYLDGKRLGVTPLEIELKRRDLAEDEGYLEFRKPGFHLRRARLFSKTNAMSMAGFVLFPVYFESTSNAKEDSGFTSSEENKPEDDVAFDFMMTTSSSATGSSSTSTDAATGAIYEYAQDEFVIDLVPLDQTPDKTAEVRYFILNNYDELVRDVRSEQGKYLESLFVIAGRRYSVAELKLIAKDASGDPNAFYLAVTKL